MFSFRDLMPPNGAACGCRGIQEEKSKMERTGERDSLWQYTKRQLDGSNNEAFVALPPVLLFFQAHFGLHVK